MSAALKVRVGVVAAGLCCWLLGSVVAAEINPGGISTNPAQPPADAANHAGQFDRSQTPATAQRVLRGQPYTANYRGTQTGGQLGQEVERYLANCLLKNNQAEVELSRFAEQQTQNPAIKQFASQLEKDHQQVVQRLEKFAGMDAATQHNTSSVLGANAATGTDNTTIRATGGRANTSTLDAATPNTGTAANANGLNRNPTNNTTAMHGGGALHQLAGIEQKINDRCNQALREELQQKSGAEFDECYLGAQIAGHMHMLAALEVISQETQGPLKLAVDEARPMVQKHLDEAKQLMTQTKGSGQSSATAKRTSLSTERKQ
jgi:predicted outer membrane protein